MSLTKPFTSQINTSDIASSEFASKASVDAVQGNVTALSANVGGGTITSQRFNTAANSNTFTLSQSVTDANAVLVTLSGVVQVPIDAYMVSNTTLTLNNTSPLISNLRLEVRYL